MDQNIQSNIPLTLVQGGTARNEKVLELVRRFLQVAGEKLPQTVRQTRKGYGFTLLKTAESLVSLNDLTSQCFDMTLIQFQKEMSSAGFRLSNQVQEGKETLKTFYRYRQQFLSGSAVEEDSCSDVSMLQGGEEWPKREELQKDDKQMKPARAELPIGRFQSDGLLGASSKKRAYDEDSIQMKLQEQDLFCTPSAHRKNTSNIHQIEEEDGPAPIADRNALYRDNYEKCSRLIDNAMIEILTAHRGKKIGEKAEELLGKVVEIYDILSDNIENVNCTIRAAGLGERKESVSSPGFKPLNGLNDNLK